MKKDSIVDYLGFLIVKFFGPIIRIMPLNWSLFLGRRIGDLIYTFDIRHRNLAFANLKIALGREREPEELLKIVKSFYRKYGQNMIDIFLMPLADKNFIKKYMEVEGKENIDEAFRRGKGVILLAVHAGSWELSNSVCAGIGFPFNFFIRQQKWPRLNKLLNSYRRERGCKIIEKELQIRSLIECLKKNEAIGMTIDQGGKLGEVVEFFGKEASMPTGAIRLALKYGSTIISAYYLRTQNFYNKVIIAAPFEIKKTGQLDQDVEYNLKNILKSYEDLIRRYPDEYLWTYKIWKYSGQRNILILGDGKTGHLRQSEALAEVIKEDLENRGKKVRINLVEAKFKNKFSQLVFSLNSIFAAKGINKGKLKLLKSCLRDDAYDQLKGISPEIIISAGSSLSALNYILSGINLAKSVVIMRPPAYLSIKRFDLIVAPLHDAVRKTKNVIQTQGALNLVTDQYLKRETEALLKVAGLSSVLKDQTNIGLLLGGNSKDFKLDKETIKNIIAQLKKFADESKPNLLVSTSRRTPVEVEVLLKNNFSGYELCKLLIIANEKNYLEVVGGILGLSKIVIISPESISMISEAASSGRSVIVFDVKVSPKHRKFLNYLSKNKYIYLVKPNEILSCLNKINTSSIQMKVLNDRELVKHNLNKII